MRSAENTFLLKYTSEKYLRIPLAIFLWIGIISLIFSSCNKPSNTQNSSVNYTHVLDSANRMYDNNKFDYAAHYLDSATNSYKDLDPGQKFQYYNFNCNYFFHYKKDNNRSMLYADSMLRLFDTPEKKVKYLAYYGEAYFYKGDVLFEENKFNEAYQYFYKGKLIANQGASKCSLGDFSYRMGMIMYKQEHYRLAAANFKNSSDETSACDLTFRYFYRRQELFSNTGLSYSKINEPDSAMMYFMKGLEFVNANYERFKVRKGLLDVARGVIYGNEADIYISKNNFDKARNLLSQSIAINLLKGNDNVDAELSELKLARLYYKANEADSMLSQLNRIHEQLDSVKNDEVKADWNLLMSNYFIKQNNPGKGLSYFIKYDALKDSIISRNKALKEADLAQQLKRLEKDNEFETLKRNNENQDLYLKITSVFGAMLLIIFLLILLNWRKSRKNIKILGSLNHQINDQNYSLEQALDELKISSQEKDRILRTVAHDLRNPIGGIAALTAAMADDDYTEEQKELIMLIKDTSNNSLELINEILEVTNNGSTSISKELVEINSLISRSVGLLRFKAAEKDQQIELLLLEAPVELFISGEKIWRVISNLISNAIKFSPEGAVIYVKIEETENEVEISVSDHGIGIPDKIKNKVFNMFTEAKRPGTAGEKSFGLGLSISRQIIENHHGEIWFDSDLENGTTFYIRLPKP